MSDKALSSLTRTTTTDTGDLMYVVDEANSRGVHVGNFRTSIGLPATGSSTDNAVARFDGTGGKLQNSDVTISDTGLMTIGSDADITHPEVWEASRRLRLGTVLSLQGDATNGSANENALSIHVHVPVTGFLNSYEKCAAIFIGTTDDPSPDPGTKFGDVVGLDRRGYIKSGNMTGRAWGGTDWALCESGSDGLLIGNEIDIANNGSNQATLDTTTTKIGLQIVSLANAVTAAMQFVKDGGASGGFHRGLFMHPNALETNGLFLDLFDAFKVDKSGNLMAAGGMRVGFTGTPAAADRVEIGDANFYIDFNSGSPLLTFDAGGDAFRYDRTGNQWIWAIGGTDEAVLSAAAFRPSANDGLALGSATESFADLFLASGAVINFVNGDVTVTHSTNSLAFAGASSGYSFDAIVSGTNLTMSGGVRVGFTGTPGADDRVEIGDGNFYFDFNSGTPISIFDGGDAYRYDRSGNQWVWAIGGADFLVFNAGGVNITGALQTDTLRIDQTPTTMSTNPVTVGSAGTINTRIQVSMNGTTYWIPASTTAF